ncbi:related to DNA-damage inducible protein 2 [Melanopsichium pennsylvanicum]|uniref:DNA damage-inducible protein 1 n=2 Tax=Melanopsichium pennsylvanicum TaxID=63383 RepID=A0AAJ4XI02_9BASI|nr:related to DNA-damage inducible protein 2 [Melanopsichium pennsylvanicum 4]SNX82729.1 related to DNA-damage inducible protein 2 [Melanopsichium pennsylvanicum]
MITVITESDQTFPIDVDATIELENLSALLEVDSSIPAQHQQLLHKGNPLNEPKATLASLGVSNDDLLILRDRRLVASHSVSHPSADRLHHNRAQSSEQQAAEQLRQQILSEPAALAMLRTNNPTLADAAANSPTRFLQLLREQRDSMRPVTDARLDDITDEFDIEAQRRIEENIRQAAVMENLEHAMEYSPESFGRVTMLYVDVKVNGTPIKAFVDSGAQATIMSPECAQKCGIMRLLDTRFAGIARGVGTAKILGRVHSTQLQLGKGLFLPCSFTIMEGKGVDMLFGLDMLKRYQATIDLGKNALVVNGEEIRFLDEHELPAEANAEYELDEQGNPRPVNKDGKADADKRATTSALSAASANANAAAATTSAAVAGGSAERFPGAGQAIGDGNGGVASGASGSTGTSGQSHFEDHGWSFSHPNAPPSGATRSNSQTRAQAQAQAQAQARPSPPAAVAASAASWPAQCIKALTDLGASQAQAITFLNAADGNLEIAASLLFQQ